MATELPLLDGNVEGSLAEQRSKFFDGRRVPQVQPSPNRKISVLGHFCNFGPLNTRQPINLGDLRPKQALVALKTKLTINLFA